MPWYKTGTVAVTLNNGTVIGTGTTFAANARVGDAFRGPDGGWYEITNIASDTTLSISPDYQGVTNVAGGYALAPLQGYVKSSADQLRSLVNQFGATFAALGPSGTASGIKTALGLDPLQAQVTSLDQTKAANGANSDITSLNGLTTPLSAAQGGTGGTTLLGNAAFQTIQTSSIDGAGGHLMAVGAFGLGADALGIPLITNLNATVNVGFYKFGAGATGAPGPIAANGGSLVVTGLGGNFIQQICLSIVGATSNPSMFYRHFDGAGNPGSWVNMFHNANMVGLCTQVSGTPTGAILEKGSNANGNYTRFASGLQICEGPIPTFAVPPGVTVGPTVTFAATFMDGSYAVSLFGIPDGFSDVYGFVYASTKSPSTYAGVYRNGLNAQNIVQGRYLCVGRWF